MKSIFLFLIVLCSFSSFSQDRKSKKNRKTEKLVLMQKIEVKTVSIINDNPIEFNKIIRDLNTKQFVSCICDPVPSYYVKIYDEADGIKTMNRIDIQRSASKPAFPISSDIFIK